MRDVSVTPPAVEERELALRSAWPTRTHSFLETDGTVVAAVAVFAIVLLVALHQALVADAWFTLVSGREIVRHGLPDRDPLAVWTHGRRWVDQQWLAQIAFYGLWRLGGLKLALLVHVGLATGAVAGAATLARRLGATARATTWVCLPAILALAPVVTVLRAQSFAYPLFVAVLWLLVRDARAPTRRVFAVVPLLVLWASVHGSVLLGALLVTLAGTVQVATGLLASPRRVSRRGLALALAAWPCVLASPYATDLPGYYERILRGGDLGHFVTEWEPTTLRVLTIPTYLLALGGLWLLGRSGRRLSWFERLAFAGAVLLALQALRNMVWLALVAVALLPAAIETSEHPTAKRRAINRLAGMVAAPVALVAVCATAAHGQSWFLRDLPAAAAAEASRLAGAHGTVFANPSDADWLLWSRPELRGRVAFDIRFELLTQGELRRITGFLGRVGDPAATARQVRVLLLDARHDAALRRELVRAGVARTVLVTGGFALLRVERS